LVIKPETIMRLSFLFFFLIILLFLSCNKGTEFILPENSFNKTSITSIGAGNATLQGSITFTDSTDNYSHHGFCWKFKYDYNSAIITSAPTFPYSNIPTTNDSLINLGVLNTSKPFTATLNNLLPGATYVARPYALNSNTLVYGDTFSFTVPSIAFNTMNAPFGRQNAALTTLGGKAYLMGGDSAGIVKNDFWIFNEGTNQWQRLPAFPGGITTMPAMFADDTTVYAGIGETNQPINGGQNEFDLWSYNPDSNSWSSKISANTINGSSVGGPVSYYFSIAGNGYANASYDFSEYNPLNNKWSSATSFSIATNNHTIYYTISTNNLSINNKGYVLYSTNLSNIAETPVLAVSAYNPISQSWSSYDTLVNFYNTTNTTPITPLYAWPVNNSIYMLLYNYPVYSYGSNLNNSSTNQAIVVSVSNPLIPIVTTVTALLEYNTVTNKTSVKAINPVGLGTLGSNGVAFALNGTCYVGLGSISTSNNSTSFSYPTTIYSFTP